MVRKKTDIMFQEAGKALQEAVYEEMVRKSKLGQYAVIEKDGKICRLPASEILKDMNKNEPVSGHHQ